MNPIPMRRHRQQLSQQQSINLLEFSTSGTLSLNQPDGFPYQVPLSYVYTDGKLYFHCAQSGYKLDLLRQDDRAGFLCHRTGPDLSRALHHLLSERGAARQGAHRGAAR